MVTRRIEPVDFLNLVTRELLVIDDARIEGDLTVIGTLTVSSSISFLGTLTVNVGAAGTAAYVAQVSAVTRWQVTGDGTMTWHDGAGAADVSLSRTAANVLTLAAGDSFAIADLTTGSVVFSAASGVLSQDNANFFWDDGSNRLGIGTATPALTLHAEEDDASNASVTEMLRLTHTTSGAPGVGIGAGIEFEVETSAANNEIGALIEAITTNVGAGTEAFDLAFSTMTAGAAAAQRMLLNAAGLTFPLATTISTSAGGLTITPTTNTFFSNGTGVVIGHTAQITASNTSELQVLGTGGPDGSVIIARFSANSSPPGINFLKSRNAAIGSNTIVQDNDLIGQIKFLPDDGADFSTTAALFLAEVDDASPAAGDIGMAFVWQQMPGGGGAIRETMRLTAAGNLTFAQATTISTTAGDLTLAPTGTDVILPDNTALSLGAGADSRIFYDGTDTFWDLRAVGTGDLLIALAAGFPSPDPNSVHIWRGSAGVISANASSMLVLEDDTVAYISFLTPNTVAPAILFGDPEANNSGALFYIHTTDTFRFRTGGVNRLDYSAGAFTFLEATTISTTAGNLILAAVAGAEVVVNDAGADVNFRVEGTGNINLLHADFGLATVGVGRVGQSEVRLTLGGSFTGANPQMLSVDNITYTVTANQTISSSALIIGGTWAGDIAGRTITDLAALRVFGPVQGANMTITNLLALLVQSGNSRFEGELSLTDNNALALGTGLDSRIFYDGTDTFWDLRAVGTGDLMIALAAGFPSPDPDVVHIWRGDAGAITANANSVLVIERDNDAFISILTPVGSEGGIVWANPDSGQRANLTYHGSGDTPADAFSFRIDGVDRLVWSVGAFAFQEAMIISTTAGDLTLAPTGNVVLGNDALIQRDVNAALTASTTQTQGQGALTAEVNEVATVANANDTVTLPSAIAGLKIVIINNGAQTLRIFPASGDNLGSGVDTATTLAAGSNIVFAAYDATNWESV